MLFFTRVFIEIGYPAVWLKLVYYVLGLYTECTRCVLMEYSGRPQTGINKVKAHACQKEPLMSFFI